MDTSNSLVRDLIRLGDLDGASRAVESELQRREKESSPEVWLLRLAWADLLRLRGQTEASLDYLTAQEGLVPPGKQDIASRAGIKKTRGYCLGHLGQFRKAHGLLDDAECMARGSGLLELLCEVHQCQAMIYYLQQDYPSSDQIFRTILSLSERVGGWYFRGNARWGIGKNLMIQEHFTEAMPWLENSLSIFEAAGARALMAVVWSELAVCYLGLGDDMRSLELLENALEIHKETESKTIL